MDMCGHVLGAPRFILRSEGLAVLVASLWGYRHYGAPMLLVPLVLFLPDLFMVGYLASTRIGAAIYNTGHTYLVPTALWLTAAIIESPGTKAAALVWAAHIGMDRLLGYGLKYPDSFRNTHLGQLNSGKSSRTAE
jgi:hypothetical protein